MRRHATTSRDRSSRRRWRARILRALAWFVAGAAINWAIVIALASEIELGRPRLYVSEFNSTVEIGAAADSVPYDAWRIDRFGSSAWFIWSDQVDGQQRPELPYQRVRIGIPLRCTVMDGHVDWERSRTSSLAGGVAIDPETGGLPTDARVPPPSPVWLPIRPQPLPFLVNALATTALLWLLVTGVRSLPDLVRRRTLPGNPVRRGRIGVLGVASVVLIAVAVESIVTTILLNRPQPAWPLNRSADDVAREHDEESWYASLDGYTTWTTDFSTIWWHRTPQWPKPSGFYVSDFVELSASLDARHQHAFEQALAPSADGAIRTDVRIVGAPFTSVSTTRAMTDASATDADDVVLPQRIHPAEFAGNVLFHALWITLTLSTASATRRNWRTTRGRCATCAYPLGSSDRCPECGAT